MKDTKNQIDHDLPVIGSLFVLLIVLFLYGQSEYRNYKNVQLMGQAITVIEKQDKENDELREGLWSMNKYADELEKKLETLAELDKILKDIDRSLDK